MSKACTTARSSSSTMRTAAVRMASSNKGGGRPKVLRVGVVAAARSSARSVPAPQRVGSLGLPSSRGRAPLQIRSAAGATRSVVCMVFERFTERAIKAVMAAQNEARAMGRPEVTTDELLLGLVVEDSAARTANNRSGGFMSTGITIHRAREVVRVLPGGCLSFRRRLEGIG